MENFDAVGRWRAQQDGEGLHLWGRNAPPIINEGRLPNGHAFANFAEFKAGVAAQGARFERGLAEKLTIYALGRTLEPSDDALINQLVTDMAANGHTLRSLIRGIVHSEAFRSK